MAAMKFEIEELPREETLAAKCPGENEAYTSFGFIRVKPTNCILPAIYKNSLEDIRNFEVRQDDIFLISNPKCGKFFKKNYFTYLTSRWLASP